MATTNGVSGSSSVSNLRGYGGISSGLNRDELIDGMTYATRSKIAKQQQKIDTLEWKQEAVRGISDLMIVFAEKYTNSLASQTNIMGSNLWGRSNITTTGANSKFVSVSGAAASAEALSIMGVKQMAENAKWTSGAVSSKSLSGSAIDTTASTTVQNLVGTTISFKYGDQDLTVSLAAADSNGNKYDYSSADKIAAALNKQMENIDVNIGGGTMKKLSDVVSVSATGGDIRIERGASAGGNALAITGGSALDTLGFAEPGEDGIKVEAGGVQGTVKTDQLTTEKGFAEMVAGQTLTFTYNGKSANIKLPAAGDLTGDALGKIGSSLQEQLNKEFGTGRVEVSTAGGKLELKTKIPGGGDDTTSTLSVSGGNDTMSALGLSAGASNRLNLGAKIDQAGLAGNGSGSLVGKKLIVNDKEIEVTADDTLNSLMSRIEKEAGVKVSYQTSSDKFIFTATENGASGTVKIGGDAADAIFGAGASSVDVRGQDAIIAAKYGNSDEVVELVRDSNTFMENGMSIAVKGEFGYKDDGTGKVLDTAAEPVSFSANVNTDKVVDAVKAMIKDYNDIITLVNKEATTKPDRKYAPLTKEQRDEMSETEIKNWEEKAKQGLLFGDSDLRTLSNDLRFIIDPKDIEKFKEIGITTSKTALDNGKLVLDEEKLKAALATDPDKVRDLFAREAGTGANGEKVAAGLGQKLKSVMDKYVKTMGADKGVLIQKAGHKTSPLSMTTNGMYKQIEAMKKVLDSLNTRLKTEQDRYISQFTDLERLISQMNSQSEYLAGMSGY